MRENQNSAWILQECTVRTFIETKDSDFNSASFFARKPDIGLHAGSDATVR
jgi:hypothetical protein